MARLDPGLLARARERQMVLLNYYPDHRAGSVFWPYQAPGDYSRALAREMRRQRLSLPQQGRTVVVRLSRLAKVALTILILCATIGALAIVGAVYALLTWRFA